MITKTDFNAVLSNIGRQSPLDLDERLFEPKEMGALFDVDAADGPLGDRLWSFSDPSISFIGCRVSAPLEHPDRLAARLAAVALERKVHTVFLSYVPDCGMQRFGFRVEQLNGLTEDAQQHLEAQLVRFWKLAMVLDASELGQLR